jgi:acylphosphatase
MKLKVKITGPKVHDVGYRYFLMTNAIDLGLRGFHARNWGSGENQEVIALVEGDEEAIADFKVLVETRKPDHADVSNIAFVDFKGDVMKTESYAQVCSALQLNKAIPILLAIRDDTKKGLDEIKEEIKGLRDDIQPNHARQMQADIQEIKAYLGMH